MTLRRFSINFTFHLKNHQSMDGPVSPVPSHHNVPVPFAADIPGGVFPGKAILLKGLVLNSSREHRIQVDLCCGKLVQGDHQDDKALHLNPRFGHGSLFSKPDRDFVLNSLVNNSWGPEQRCQNPLEQGKPFSLRILILRDYFKISVNGKHLSDFIHRVPLESIKCIFVAGCLSIDLIEYQGTRPGPQPSCPEPNAPCPDGLEEPIEIEKPEVPFIFKVPPGGFLPPREAHLVLTPLLNSTSFAVNLLCADEYLFHMRVDFPNQNGADERGAVVRNSSTEGGQWQREERQMGRFPFVQGLTSDVKLVAGAQGIRVFIDGAYFCDFNHRPSGPIATEVTQLTVLGDVGVQRFTFRNKATK